MLHFGHSCGTRSLCPCPGSDSDTLTPESQPVSKGIYERLEERQL
jgi:hypothetical protein